MNHSWETLDSLNYPRHGTQAIVSGTMAGPKLIRLDHVDGNEGLFVTDVTLSGADAADFSFPLAPAPPFLIPIAEGRNVWVEYTGSTEGATASLDVTYSGGELLSVPLTVPEPGAALSLLVGSLGLLGLGRRVG